jgi:hypothetical protein
VTKATVWLAPASEFVRDLVARVDALPPVVDAFRELLLEGTLRSNVVLWNDVKAMALARQYPFEEAGGRTPLPGELLAAWREASGVGAWSGATTVFAPDRGIGLTTLEAAQLKNFTVLSAGVLIIGVTYVVVTLVADILSALLNPRIRFEASE